MGPPPLYAYSRGEWGATDAIFPTTYEGIMKTIPDFAREILSRSPAPALPLARLLDAIEEETAGYVVSAGRMLAEIRSRPDLFRVLDPMIGPWRRSTAKPGEAPPWSPETWVLGLDPNTRASSPVSARTAESLRCLGRRVDENSATAVARWLLLIERGSSDAMGAYESTERGNQRSGVASEVSEESITPG